MASSAFSVPLNIFQAANEFKAARTARYQLFSFSLGILSRGERYCL
jgi:hypothetical protein